ncbi:nickel-dependent lactate racemase [candidate division WOR-3 bacterium]|nr:nickel-dependent lactate racemase [candidate division WOR-3 bacterium]
MVLDIGYGDKQLPLTVPDRNLLGVLEPPPCEPFHDTAAELARASAALAGFLQPAHRVLVLINDYTRPTPNAQLLAALRTVLNPKETRYLVCLGTHRAPTEPELDAMLGPAFARAHRAQVVYHDCRDRHRLVFLGKTGFGTEVWLSRELLWADRVLTVNSVEPHYFAGYTGGRKAFLPGIAGLHTITHNHNLVTHPASLPFNLQGNPVHEDMLEAARMVTPPVYSIQVVQDRNRRLLSVRHGDLQDSFAHACADAHRAYAVPVKQRADVVLSALRSPYDINFYQSQRAVEFARPVLKEPSVQITVSRCRDGIGNDGFIQIFKRCAGAADVLRLSGHDARPGWHKSARLARIMQTTELHTVMDIDDAVVKSAFMHPFPTPQKALDAALARLGPDASVYVIPDAGAVVPVLPA